VHIIEKKLNKDKDDKFVDMDEFTFGLKTNKEKIDLFVETLIKAGFPVHDTR
jgi:hypothetical protein